MPEEIQIIQQADDLNDIDSEIYYVKSFETIDDIKESYQRFHRAGVTIIPPETDIQANEARAQRIKEELQRINKIIEENGGFDQWRKKSFYSLKDKKEQRTINNVLFSWKENSLKKFAAKYPEENSVAGLSALNTFLLKNGIHLIVLFWPSPEEVAADLFFPEDIAKGQYLDIIRVQLMQELLKQNIETIDLLPPLKEKRFDYPPLLFQAHLYDEHPASAAARIAGETIADILKRYSFEENKKDTFSLKQFPMSSSRKYEDYTETGVTLNGAKFSFDKNSDLLFAGDSFAYHPQTQSSVGAFCSYFLKKRSSLHSRSGGAQRLFRTLLQMQQQQCLLNQKKVIVLSVVPSHLKINWEIPVGYPDFKEATYEIIKKYSSNNRFKDITAKWSDSNTECDFSTGIIDSTEATEHSKEKVLLSIPEIIDVKEGVLRIIIKSKGYNKIYFSENGSERVLYTCGGLWNDNEEELLIPFHTGTKMILEIPTDVVFCEIGILKTIER